MTPRVIYMVKRAEIEITARMGRVLEPFGLTPIQYSLLYFIDINQGDLSSAQLSRRFSVTPQSMNELVRLLEKKKWVKKRVDPAHRRILRIRLTAQGKKLVERCGLALDALEEDLFRELKPSALQTLRRLLGQILDSARESAAMEK